MTMTAARLRRRRVSREASARLPVSARRQPVRDVLKRYLPVQAQERGGKRR